MTTIEKKNDNLSQSMSKRIFNSAIPHAEGSFILGKFKVPFKLKIENACNLETKFLWEFDFSDWKECGDRHVEIVMEQTRKDPTQNPVEWHLPVSRKDFHRLNHDELATDRSKRYHVEMISAQSYDQGVKWEYKILSDNDVNTFATVQKVKWSVTDLMIMFIVKLKVIKKQHGLESKHVTFLLPLNSKISTQPALNILRIDNGTSGKSCMINTLFQSLGSLERPALHYPDNSLKGTRELKVFTCLDPGGNPHFNTSFRFIDAKGFTFEPKDKTSMKKLQKILEGLPEGTLETKCLESPQNIAHKPKFAIISCDARSLVYLSYEPNWISSWLFKTSYSINEQLLDQMIELKNKIDETLGQDRLVFVFTHMDFILPSNQSLLMQKLVEKNISPNVVFYAAKDKSKCTQECEDYCDHWTKETLSGLFQMLCNFKVTSQDHHDE